MIIKKVENGVFDVFWDIGWDHWARMKMGENGKWQSTGGINMPKQVFLEFRNRMYRRKGKNQFGATKK